MAANNQNGWLNNLGLGGYGGTPLSVVPEQQAGPSDGGGQFEQLDRAAAGSNTLKRNPKMELSKSDLLKLVTYFEGEIQARDIVIAALKSEKLKQIANMGRYRPAMMADPYNALLRDCTMDASNTKPAIPERDINQTAEQQLQALEQLAIQQKRAHQHMVNILKEAENKHRKVIQELEEEKCKHEHDTAQGDDITYGLEMERTRLRQELEVEKAARKKAEKEVKRHQELADEERGRQKQIVLLLLAERKKIIVKYIEERKRSEDLAQILSEEKARIDSMAEGLEEESKKSLQMEAELEKQLHVFETDKKTLKTALALKDARCQELEFEMQKMRDAETTTATTTRTMVRAPRELGDGGAGVVGAAAPMTSSVAKVVQPTATVSSVPVSGPTTGIAQSVSPGQVLRQPATTPSAVKASNLTQIKATAPPATPPKKGAVVGRGVPPPIPPNKPIIPSKQNVVRRADAGEPTSDNKRASLHKDVVGAVSTAATAAIMTTASTSTSTPAAGIEMLGQELADFQQMLVTMATSNNT